MWLSAWGVAAVLAAVPLSVDGGLPSPVIDDVLRWHANELNACFQGAPKSAQLKYRFGITPEGHVGSLGFIDARGLDSSRVTCLGTIVEKLAFPAVDGGTSVELTFKPTTPFDAGVPELESLSTGSFPPSWAEAIYRCHWTNEKAVRDGRLTLDLWVTPSGAVVDAAVSDATPGLLVEGFLPCVSSSATHWALERHATWRRAQVSLIIGRTEDAEKKYFNPKEPAAFVHVRGSPAPAGVPGGLESSVIKDVIQRNTSVIKYCYESRLQLKPTLAGKVSVAFLIGADGKVIHATVEEDETGDEQLGKCICERVLTWEFPQPVGGGHVNVTYPWIFKAAGRD